MKKTADMKEIRESPNWKRSPLGIPLGKEHFREVGGGGHAVCDPSTGTCKLHEDEFNPDEGIVDMVLHALCDLPEDLQRGIGAALSLAGLLLLASEKIEEIVGALALSVGELFLELGDAEFSVLDVMTEN